ncbi:carotenoid oxygenase family protein [Stella sp.]|uniref:carotenoid oxygenase family protein n=1 Tax=Stella sp. TaxID=2912054 RepID=UPI0035B0229A
MFATTDTMTRPPAGSGGARLAGNFAPVVVERDLADLPVLGELPRELDGTLFRNGPNPRFPAADAHWFVGDGMIHAFTLADGRASYRNRWVRTPKWRAEDRAGRSLFCGFGQLRPGLPAGAGADGGVANTNVLRHGGRLLALEEGHLPIALDPATLATGDCEDFGGRVEGPFTAHPRIDPATGELVFFGYHAAGRFSATMSWGTVAADGAATRFERFETPFASMVHDFAATANHVLVPVLPLTGSRERAMSGRPAYAWEPELASHVGIFRRDAGAASLRWFRSEACYVFHLMNAWEEGDRIQADVMEMAAPPFPRPDGRPARTDDRRARLCRWTFDLSAASDRFERRFLDDLDGEFPRIDDRRSGLAYRHGWYAAARPDAPDGTYDTIAHMDFATGRRTTFLLPEGDATSEPVFVPRSPAAREGDGWLLAVVWRAAEARSDLLVFVATAIDRGPVATVALPVRVPFGLHGNWVPAG